VEIRNVIGKQIQKLRNDLGWSQSHFATKLQLCGLDVDRSQVSKIEGRTVCLSETDLLFIARTLGVRLADLYPAKFKEAKDLYQVIKEAKASRYGIWLFWLLVSCASSGAGVFA
jgi:transcriptional regulator with XRE-family HTH domain